LWVILQETLNVVIMKNQHDLQNPGIVLSVLGVLL
jgi:hypothetical protein